MEIFGGFMVMMSIISLFLAVVWLVMPFVVFAIKGKQDRTLEILETIDARLAFLEARIGQTEPEQSQAGHTVSSDAPVASPDTFTNEHTMMPVEHAVGKKDPEVPPAE